MHEVHRVEQLPSQIAAARAAGDEDARAGVNNHWSLATKPAALRAIEAQRDQNLVFVRGVTDTAVAKAEANAADADRRQLQAEHDLHDGVAERDDAAAQLADLPEARHGWLRVPGWIIGLASLAILGADVIFTQTALIKPLGFLPGWESWTLAVLIGALLFIVGAGEGYLHSATEQAEDAGVRPPINVRSAKRLERALFWSAGATLVGLAAARFSLVDYELLEGLAWVGAIGAFIAVVAAPVLVVVVAYLGARVLLAARPRAAAARRVKKATAQVALRTEQHLVAQRVADDAGAHAAGTRPNHESAVRAAEEAWMEVICAYWRGFSLVRPDEQPDIDAINRLTNAPRRIHLDEVVA